MHHFFGMVLNNTTTYLREAELPALVRKDELIAVGSVSYVIDTPDTEVSEYGAVLV